LAAVSGALVGVAAFSGVGGLAALLIPLFFYIASIGLVGANAIAACLSLFPTRAGTASALVGTLQFLAGALASAFLGAISAASALPMAAVIAAAGVLSLVIHRSLARA
jgi:DHA1 family bicyclomycin/chloramphenicol resistance-like MFS transporter